MTWNDDNAEDRQGDALGRSVFKHSKKMISNSSFGSRSRHEGPFVLFLARMMFFDGCLNPDQDALWLKDRRGAVNADRCPDSFLPGTLIGVMIGEDKQSGDDWVCRRKERLCAAVGFVTNVRSSGKRGRDCLLSSVWFWLGMRCIAAEM